MSEQAIEFLGWLPMGERLRASVERARDLATETQASEISIDHLLRAFDEDVDVNVYLAHCGVERSYAATLFQGAGQSVASREAVASAQIEPDHGGDAEPGYWRNHEEPSAPTQWEGRSQDSFRIGYSDRVSENYSGGYASLSGSRRAPQPGRALRRLMARASQAAETLGRDRLTSELTLQVLAVDAAEPEGKRLASLLPEGERARLENELGAIGSIAQGSDPGAPSSATSEALFKSLAGQIEALLMTLHGELQKDMRYRIANDLAAFMTQARPGEEALQNSALPILHATRAELEREPHYLALERIRGVLRTIRAEEGQVRAALGGLAREGRLEPGGALAEVAGRIVEIPEREAFDSQEEPRVTVADALSEDRPFAGPALVHAARSGASPWEGLAESRARRDDDFEPETDEAELDEIDAPSAGRDEIEHAAAPLFGRVFRSVRERSMFSRRRGGAA